MAVRKLKPVEVDDGSYGGAVLAAWDRLAVSEQGDLFSASDATPAPQALGAGDPHRAWLAVMGGIENELQRLQYKAGQMERGVWNANDAQVDRVQQGQSEELFTLSKAETDNAR